MAQAHQLWQDSILHQGFGQLVAMIGQPAKGNRRRLLNAAHKRIQRSHGQVRVPIMRDERFSSP